MKNCSLCGKSFGCGANTGKPCWCMDVGEAKVPASAEDCLCRDCLLKHADYYMEEGLMVFTEAYHLKRGSCCNSGCRHCPYIKTNSF
jgi:hypothetical protein